MTKEPKFKLDTCHWCTVEGRPADTWCEILRVHNKEGRIIERPLCRACKVVRFYRYILYPSLNMDLMRWQEKILRDLYGTRDEEGYRQYEHGYISVAKQNGKTFLLGGLPIYHMTQERDLEPNPEVYGTAGSKEQGGLVFKACANLIKNNPDFKWRFRILETTKKIVLSDGAGFYVVISADGNFQDGIRPSLLLRDEVHRWKSARAKTLYDVTTKGQISRKNPLDLGISTAGAQYESPLWYQEYEQSKAILRAGLMEKGSYYVAIWEPDLKRIENDPDYWKSREARVAANPSHEDNGGFLRDKSLVAEMNKALHNPAEKSAYLRYNLNVPTYHETEPIIDMPKWRECGGGVDLREWPSYDVDLLIRKWNLLEKACVAGIDASWSIDFTALVLVFAPFEKDKMGQGSKAWTFLPFFWVPEKKVPKLEHVCKIPLSTWISQGFVYQTPGQLIDQREVVDKVKWACQMFNVIEGAYDRCNFRSEALNLSDEGIVMSEVPQTFLGLSPATKVFLEQYLEHGIRHGNNPVMDWMASCLQVQYDKKDNVQPTKPDRLTSAKRIDGCQAAVTALARATVIPMGAPQGIEVW